MDSATKDTYQQLKKIVYSHVPDATYKAFVFGSRARGQNRPFSDLDVGILGPEPLPSQTYIELVDALENSDIPYRVDLVDFASAADTFKQKAIVRAIGL